MAISLMDQLRANRDKTAPRPAPIPIAHTPTAVQGGELEVLTAEPDALVEFLQTVLPATGHYAMFRAKSARHIWCDSIPELAQVVRDQGDAPDIYFGTASFTEATSRSQANAERLKSLRLDLDAGAAKLAKHGAEMVYEDQAAALTDLVRFSKETGLRPSIIVSSGEGLHVYYVLDAPMLAQHWTPLANQFKAFVKRHGLKADPAVTADSARILRPIGTKHPNGKTVEVIKNTGKVYSATEFAGLVGGVAGAPDGALSGAGGRVWDDSINADIATTNEWPKASAALIAGRCGVMGEIRDTAGNVSEPLWRAGIGILKHSTDGAALLHQWSNGHPQYSERETQTKFDRWETGPTTCAHFADQSGKCAACEHRGKITSPIQLGSVDSPETPKTISPLGPKAFSDAIKRAGWEVVADTDGQINLVVVSTRGALPVRSCSYIESQISIDALMTATSSGGRTVSDQVIKLFAAKARHGARETGVSMPVYLRCAYVGGNVYVDHGPGTVVRIGLDGWQVQEDTAQGVPLFRRSAGAGTIPVPVFDGTAEQALVFARGVLTDVFGLTQVQALVLLAAFLEWRRTNTPHPIVELIGGAGSGKSTLADFIRWLLDPSRDGTRLTVGTDGKDIGAAAQQWYLLPVDNAGKVDKSLSDMMCIISTGGSLSVRKLYANAETVELKLHRPMVITAVNPVCTAPDLQSRVLRFEMPRREGGHKSEEELRTDLSALMPRMLGALYTLLSGALDKLPAARLGGHWTHRLADFDQMGSAMMLACGEDAKVFMLAVGQMRVNMARKAASGDLFVIALVRALKKMAATPTHTVRPTLNAVVGESRGIVVVVPEGSAEVEVIARPSALLTALRLVAADYRLNDALPVTDRGLGEAVRRVQPLLSQIDIEVSEATAGTRRLIAIRFELGALDDV